MLIDPDRELHPVSGTAVRASPVQNWRWLPPPVQPIPPESLSGGTAEHGKTTLSALAALKTTYMTEHGRNYDAFTGGRGGPPPTSCTLPRCTSIRKPLMERAGALFFEDTDALQTVVWSERLGAPMSVTALLPDFEPADLYLLLSPEVPWLDDGTRYLRLPRRASGFSSAPRLLEPGAPYEIIAGDSWEERTRWPRSVCRRACAELVDVAEAPPRGQRNVPRRAVVDESVL